MVLTYAIISVLIVSLISLVGLLTISIKLDKLKKLLIYMVSFSAGALFGDVFFHLLPEIVEHNGFTLKIALSLLLGILLSFLLEKVINWRHCHIHPKSKPWSIPICLLDYGRRKYSCAVSCLPNRMQAPPIRVPRVQGL